MPRYTPTYALPALAPTDRARDIADIDWANAQRIEAILAGQGQLPLDSDIVAILAGGTSFALTAANSSWTVSGSDARRLGSRVKLLCLANADTDVAASTGAGVLVGTIPTGYRPKTTYYVPMTCTGRTAPTSGVAEIRNSGEVNIFNADTVHRSFGFYIEYSV